MVVASRAVCTRMIIVSRKRISGRVDVSPRCTPLHASNLRATVPAFGQVYQSYS